jgi:hypothetical protein
MQLKDDSVQAEAPASDTEMIAEVEALAEEKNPEILDPIHGIWNRLEKNVGESAGVENIYHDSSWDDLIAQLTGIGKFFKAGRFMVGHIDKGEIYNFILLPGKETTVVTVSPKCPRDKLLQILSSYTI